MIEQDITGQDMKRQDVIGTGSGKTGYDSARYEITGCDRDRL